MAIYAVQGLYAAGCLAMAYPLYRWVLNPSFLANHKGVLTDDKIKGFVRSKANRDFTKNEINAFVESEYKQKHTEDEIKAFVTSQAKIGAHTKVEIENFVQSVVNKTLTQDKVEDFGNSQIKGALTGSEIKSFVKSQSKKMGVEKEIIVIQGQTNGFWAYGNTWFSGKVGIELPKKFGEAWKFAITHQIVHIIANDYLITFGAVLATALFTTFVLAVNRDLFTGYLGGMGAGLITGVVLRRRAEKKADQEAMGYCERDINQAYLNRLLEDKKNGYGRDLRSWIFWPVEPSLDEKIGYFQAHFKRVP